VTPELELPAQAPLSPTRRRWFRLLAFAGPLLVLSAAELGLRLSGYGYPTAFFLNSRQGNIPGLSANPKFGWRFFPPALARSPLPLSLRPAKPAGTCRIFVFGESAAMGDPEPAYGFPRQLERLLQARHPDRNIEVVNVAMTAINSHVIREIARDCAPLSGDAWVLYAGNNEIIGPFGAGTVFGPQNPSLASIRLTLALRKTRLAQFVENCFRRTASADWQGMEMFLKYQIPADDPRLAAVQARFAANLSDIIATGQKARAKVFVATVPVNLTNCPPFASLHRRGLSAGGLADWEKIFERGCRAEAEQRVADALTAYQEAGRLDSEFAELVYRRARCELVQGQVSAAERDFRRARDLDTLRFRADSRLNESIRQTAAAKGVTLIDAEQEFAGPLSPGGQDLFYDHVHLNFKGNRILAARLAVELERELLGPVPAGPGRGGVDSTKAGPSSAPTSWLPEEELARRLAFTDFDRRRVLEEMRARLRQPPFKTQLNFQQRDALLLQELAAPPIPPRDLRPLYHDAIALAPDDYVLHANFARLLEAAADAAGAAGQWREVARLCPQEPDPWFHLGNLEYNAGRHADAARLFHQALECRPGCSEAINGLGLALAAQGKANEAVRQFETVLRADPRCSAARINLALVLASRGDASGASEQYRTALRLDPENAAARINLAKLLAGRGQTGQAITLYEEALQLKPDDPVAHFDLANALAARNQHAEALPHYAAAARQRPDFAEAHYNLAVEWARAGKTAEALAEFAEVVRLQPESADARYNYGVALAKLHRYSEAVREFREALQRKPDYPPTLAALDKALDLEKKAAGK
jgi:tetratricopeptide (TPR) repeat protein